MRICRTYPDLCLCNFIYDKLNSIKTIVKVYVILDHPSYMYAHVAKTKVLISCEVTAQLICTFVFALEIKVFSRTGSYYSSQFAK